MNHYLKANLILASMSALLSGLAVQAAPATRKANKALLMLETPPLLTATVQNIGNLELTINDNGVFGFNYYSYGAPEDLRDCFTGEKIEYGLEFPKGSFRDHLSAASIWIGAVKGNDTLVSTGYSGWGYSDEFNIEFRTTSNATCGFERRSSIRKSLDYSPQAVSEQDILTTFTDTARGTSRDYFFVRPHFPLNIEITQESYAWSYSYAEDFILFNIHVENIGNETLRRLSYGLFYDGDVQGHLDDLSGFLSSAPSSQGCRARDTIDIAWIADNDGDPLDGEFFEHIVWIEGVAFQSCTHIAGICFLNKLRENQYRSFNWWIGNYDRRYDFGPRHRKNFKDFRTGGLGFPFGDVNRYHVMTNYETDYDQAYMARISVADSVWLYPDPTLTSLYGIGGETYALLSQSLYELQPGASIDFAFAVVAGENFHTDVSNLNNLPNDPDAYYNNLDFSDLAKNAMWAKWIYDNPGIDSDGDGYFGKSRVCIFDSALTGSGWVVSDAETTWYEGDGVPDWRAAGPPPAPVFWIEPTRNGLTIRFNGSRSETEKDIMTGLVDFEGYHIWLGRDDRESSYSIVGGYDLENFDKLVWNERAQPQPNFDLFESPFTIEQLRCLYGRSPDPCNDLTFEPRRFTRSDPYIHPQYSDSIFMFVPHNFNSSQLGVVGGVRKVYPDEPPPPRGAHPDSLGPEHYTENGYLKYYEYVFTIENLLPTVPYWVNVTAFDFGSAESGVSPLESSRTVGAKSAFPFVSDNRINGRSMEVYVYPNPYRINGSYRDNGYEGRTQEIMPDEKVRAIHFANLPARCTISIFSIDGDLVREIHHDVDPLDPNHLHDEWNLVTRNRQAVVSGLYYWTVEDENGNVQIGKLAIIM